MKVYSIGREVGCDIVINDNSDVISRRHAILNVFPSGKMTIVDQSHNGTYVNGIKISPNVPVPVTRKDNVSFAHISRLDWEQIPKPTSITQYVIYGVIALVVLIGGIVGYHFLSGSPEPVPTEPVQVQKTDTASVDKKKEETPLEKKDTAETKKPKQPKQQPKGGTGKGKQDDKGSKQEGKGKEDDKSKETETVSKGARH